MQVADMIKMLEVTIGQLKELDPALPVMGHINSPINGYEGDLEDPITKIDPRDEDGEVVVYIHY